MLDLLVDLLSLVVKEAQTRRKTGYQSTGMHTVHACCVTDS